MGSVCGEAGGLQIQKTVFTEALQRAWAVETVVVGAGSGAGPSLITSCMNLDNSYSLSPHFIIHKLASMRS